LTTAAGEPVVVGVDGSPRSLSAVATAAGEAALRRRPLRIVHAFTWPPVETPGMAGSSLRRCRETADAYAAEAVLLAERVAPGVSTTSEIVPGRAVSVLLDESRHADLLILGDRGLSGFAGVIIGSVAVQTAAQSSCPVLVVRGQHRRGAPVAVGVDGSRTSMLALEFAAREADMRGADLVALHAWNGNDGTELNSALPMTCESWSGDQEERRVLAESLAGLAEKYPGLQIRRQIRRGSARRLLTGWSRTAQLVVVGDRGHGGFAGVLLGSVSQRLVHRAACPVAVVRPAPAAVA